MPGGRKRHALAGGDPFKEPEVAFAVAVPGGGRHAVFQHFDEVDVEHLRLAVARVSQRLLLAEAIELLHRVVQFRVAVAQLGATDHRVEALRHQRVRSHFGQRREEGWFVNHERRAADRGADGLPKQVDAAVDVDGLGGEPDVVVLEGGGDLVDRGVKHVEVEALGHRLPVIDQCPVVVEVDVETPDGEPLAAPHLLRDITEEFPHQVHGVAVVGVGPVQLHGHMLGQVLGPDALVAKARADLVHPLVPGTDQTLQVELLADAQVEVGVDRVHVGHERLGVGATRGVLQHRDVHFQEATFGKEPPVGLPETGASLVAAPELRVDVDVDVAPTLAVAGVVHAVGMRA